MPGYYFHIGRQLRDNLLDRIDHAIDASTRLHIDKGKSVSNKVVTHVDDVGVRKKDDGIAVGVSRGEIQSANIFSIKVYGDIVIEGKDRKSFVGRGFHIHMNG